eukprot:1156437-Pelagomonas_calceolata.AAC.6
MALLKVIHFHPKLKMSPVKGNTHGPQTVCHGPQECTRRKCAQVKHQKRAPRVVKHAACPHRCPHHASHVQSSDAPSAEHLTHRVGGAGATAVERAAAIDTPRHRARLKAQRLCCMP